VVSSTADLTFTFYRYLSSHVCEQNREEWIDENAHPV